MEKNKKVINEQYIKKKGEENQCNKIMTIIGVALMMIMFFSFLNFLSSFILSPHLSIYSCLFLLLTILNCIYIYIIYNFILCVNIFFNFKFKDFE